MRIACALILLGGCFIGLNSWAQATAPVTIPVCTAKTETGRVDDMTCIAGCDVDSLTIAKAESGAGVNGTTAQTTMTLYTVAGALRCPPWIAGRPDQISNRLRGQLLQRCGAGNAEGQPISFVQLPLKIAQGELQQDKRRLVSVSGKFKCGTESGVVTGSWLQRVFNSLF